MKLFFRTSLIVGFILATSPLFAIEGGEAFTDASKAPKDFQYQGEYVGAPQQDPNFKIGCQVIALGEDKFDVVAYFGGLPGDGWSRGGETVKAKGELRDDHVFLTGDTGTAKIKDGVMTVFDATGNQVAELRKVERTSPTLGKAPPEGAVVLFDGKNADQFENGKLIEGNLLGATNTNTKLKMGDHSMHIEFRTPYMPKARGQGRGNSGVYVTSRYEVQVLDSFGLDGADNECGGIYSINKPDVNMCFPPLSWQTYDIDFTAARYNDKGEKIKNARITVKHNGVTIHNDIELTHGTPGRHPEAAGPEALFLQDHGNPVAFRNIWVVEKK